MTHYGVPLLSGSKRLLIVALVVIGWLHPVAAGSNFTVTEYASVSDVIKNTFQGPTTRSEKTLKIPPEIQRKLEKQLGARWRIDSIEWQEIFIKSNRVGAVMVFDEIGKHYPITFAVALSEKNEIKSVSVLTYRESVGADIRKPRFMSQFVKKSRQDVNTMDDAIIPITGSTLSSWAAITVAKKALLLSDIIYP